MGKTIETSDYDLPLVILGEMVIMPHMTVPLRWGRESRTVRWSMHGIATISSY